MEKKLFYGWQKIVMQMLQKRQYQIIQQHWLKLQLQWTVEEINFNYQQKMEFFIDWCIKQTFTTLTLRKITKYWFKKRKRKDIFEFNHIHKSLSESEIKPLNDFYKHYYKKYWCLKKSYNRLKHLDKTITISGICLMIIGTITGGITLNSIILGVVNGNKLCKNEKL